MVLGWSGRRIGTIDGAVVGAIVGLGFEVVELVEHVHLDVSQWSAAAVTVENVRAVIAVEVAGKFYLLGFTGHALFSALVGLGLVSLLTRPRLATLGWIGAGLLAHAAANGPGAFLVDRGLRWLVSTGAVVPAHPELAIAAVSAGAFAVAWGWAAVLLARRLRQHETLAPLSSAL